MAFKFGKMKKYMLDVYGNGSKISFFGFGGPFLPYFKSLQTEQKGYSLIDPHRQVAPVQPKYDANYFECQTSQPINVNYIDKQDGRINEIITN